MENAKSRWMALDAERSAFITKCEQLSALTIPHLCTPNGYNEKTDLLQYDDQSFGAIAVNNLQNKLMLTLFAPSRPFFRMKIDKELVEEIEINTGLSKQKLEETLSLAEKQSVEKLDSLKLRSKLNDIVLNTLALGNCLFELSDKTRVYNIRKWVCQRDVYGKLSELLIKDTIKFGHLKPEVQKDLSSFIKKNEDENVEFIRWIKRDKNGEYHESQWVDDKRLPSKYDGKYTEKTLPYIILTWSLPDGNHYGIGHVEKVFGLLTQLSILEKARIQAAVLASEFRWVVNPNGFTQVEDLEESENGSVVSGNPADIQLVSSGTTSALPHLDSQIQSIKQELARFFLIGSAQVRDAERVTAEEIRLQANELESSLGGAYTNIANDLQTPLAEFLLKNIDNPVKVGKGMRIVIVTGLDALSRNGDIDNMNAMINNMASITNLPPAMLQTLNMRAIFNFYGAGYGINTKDIFLTEEQVAANVQMQQQAQMNGADGPPPGVEPTPAPQ